MRWAMVLMAAGTLAAQTDPKARVEEYEVHAEATSAAIGAEFLVHSFSGHGAMYVMPDFLVVEVALYPKHGSVDVSAGQFVLRLNGKKMLGPTAASMVAASLEHPEWKPPAKVQAGAGIGDSTVMIGAPPPTQGPYPPRTPQPLPKPDGDHPYGVPRAAPEKAGDVARETAIPEGKHRGPVSGYLYFAYDGKAKSLKSVELLFEQAVLKLR